MNSRRVSVAISVGIVAVVMMAGCSKSSEPAAVSGSAAAASAPAADQVEAGGGWNPPLPNGLPEDIMADLLKDPALNLTQNCKEYPATTAGLTEETLQLVLPGATMDEITAFYAYYNDYMAPLCAK